MLRTILVDDERIILDDLIELLSINTQIEVVGAYQNPLDALKELEQTQPDCAFLDIEMTEMKGIELAERLITANPEIKIIFVTAYNNFASQAYDVNALDYLLKPIHPQRLKKSVEKLINKIGGKRHNPSLVCKIRCFGSFEVLIGDQPIKWGRSKSKEFLAYMLQNEGKWVTKYRLCEDLRPDDSPEQALAYLQMAIYTLRKNLKTAGCTQIEIKYADDRYALLVKDADWDIRRFEATYLDYKRTGSLDMAQTAAEIYRDEYLEGEDWLWADLQREVYRCQYDQLLRLGVIAV
jgi:two-component SAPR family response regulator